MSLRHFIVVLLLSSCGAFAQGGLYQDKAEGKIINSNTLIGIPGGQIKVCTDSACVSPITLYSDSALTVSIGTSATADVNANYRFFATPGIYWCQESATGFTTAINRCQISTTGVSTVRLTANSSAITATTPGTVFLTFSTLPVSTNLSFHCSILYNQQTAAAAGTGFAIQGATNAPTRLDAWASMFTSNAGVSVQGVVQNLATTTATAVVSGTPSAITTVFMAKIDGTIQNGASTSTLKLLAFTGNAADSITIQAGSYCSIMP